MAKSVKLHDGKEIHSGLVVSNIDARQTFFELLKGKADVPFTDKIKSMKESCSFFLLYLGIGKGVDLSNLKRGFYHTATDSSYTDGDWLYVSVPTRICPTLAPSGKHIISVVVSLKEDSYRDVADWSSFKETLTENTVNRLEAFVPDLKKYLEVKEAATPKTLERYTSNTHGAAYGWAVTVDQIWGNRLPQKTPVDNLYLTGHWTKPGPGICAVVSSGWGVANLIMENWR